MDKRLKCIPDIESIKPVSYKWEYRPKSNIVKWLMNKSGHNAEQIAEILGCKVGSFNNKLQRNSFSFDDLVLISYICGYGISFVRMNSDSEERGMYQIDVNEYFKDGDIALLSLYDYEEKVQNRKETEYKELKTKLEQMKIQYGFED